MTDYRFGQTESQKRLAFVLQSAGYL